MVKAAIETGAVKLVEKTSRVTAAALKTGKIPVETVKASGLPMNEDGDIVLPILIPEALNGKGMAALCNGKIEPQTPKPETGKDERTDAEKAIGACDRFNYAVDLEFRTPARAFIMGKLESPDKVIEKAAETLVAAGLFDSLEAARAHVVEQRKAKGLPV
jgi:hypothetical protein